METCSDSSFACSYLQTDGRLLGGSLLKNSTAVGCDKIRTSRLRCKWGTLILHLQWDGNRLSSDSFFIDLRMWQCKLTLGKELQRCQFKTCLAENVWNRSWLSSSCAAPWTWTLTDRVQNWLTQCHLCPSQTSLTVLLPQCLSHLWDGL